MSLSPWVKQKLDYLFHRYYDANKNGIVTHADFLMMSKHLQQLHDWNCDDPRIETAEERLLDVWQGLKRAADANRDQQINPSEWIEFWEKAMAEIRNGKSFQESAPWIKHYMDFLFDMMDCSGDDIIDENEYVKMGRHFGFNEEDSRRAFAKFGSQQKVDREYFGRLWLEFMTSESQDAPGNFLFGFVRDS